MKPLDKLLREHVKNFAAYASARDEFKDSDADYIFLDANENPFNTGVNRYPDPHQVELKEALSVIKKVHPNQILVGNGSDEVLDLLVRAFCNPGKDEVITLPPTYGMYSVLAKLNAITIKEVLLTSDFQPDVDAILEEASENTKMLFLCSPNNPTGNAFTEKSIEFLLENFSGIVVIDEAYIDFSKTKSWTRRLSDYPNLVVTQTLSKAYGLAGIRVGLCYASEEIIQVLTSIKPPYNVNTSSQKKALKRLKDMKTVKKEISKVKKYRNKLVAQLQEISSIEKVYPSDANFVLVKVSDSTNMYQQLIEKKIIVRNRTTQPLCENTLRFTVGTKRENKLLIQALKELA